MNDEITKILSFIESPGVNKNSEFYNKMAYKEFCQVKDVKNSATYKLGQIDGVETAFKINNLNVSITSIDELINIYARNGNSNEYKNNSDDIEITVRIKKELIIKKYSEISNLSFFTSLSEAMIHIFSIPWKDLNYKQVIYIKDLPDNQTLNSPYLLISDIEVNNISNEDTLIKEEFKDIFHDVNKYYESSSLDLYSKLPIAWIDNNSTSERNSVYILKQIELLMGLICNKSISNDTFVIRGYKAITFSITPADFTNLKQVEDVNKKLFYFLLDKEKYYDKKIILRNTLTLYLNDTATTINYVKNCEEIYKSVEYNFNLYVQNKIEIFLEQKNKLLQEFIDVSRKMQDRAQSVSDQLRTVGLSLLGTIFISLLNNLNMSFSKPMINIVLLSYIIYFCINIVLILFNRSNVKVVEANLREYVNSFGDFQFENQNEYLSYEELHKKYLKKPIGNFNILSWGTIIFLGILIICFLSIYLSLRFGKLLFFLDLLYKLIGF
ncbi:hypothetical protein [Listeria cossartiae]|uniref:hypothetical protein n=1 Tax=Listeria cossartiae TaxID=2838249 RepID=UPI0028802A1D|nr:hypothetical protein [Listeria cossartiae]MDT0013852.1 hypothetical protein [Listeria cossartiae subsp. cayugensis]